MDVTPQSSPRPLPARIALGILVVVHLLGAFGAPYAASIHLWQEGATPHQDFHVLWEALKYFTASILALGVVLGPLAKGERWAFWLILVSTLILFGGVFIADALTGGAPTIDRWAYGILLAASLISLLVLKRTLM